MARCVGAEPIKQTEQIRLAKLTISPSQQTISAGKPIQMWQ
jgi:hypothetical protein